MFEKKSMMFPFITESRFNPLGGDCKHNCYKNNCWAKRQISRFNMKKYAGEPRIIEHELKRVFKPTDFVFVCDMCDLLGDWVPANMIAQIVHYANSSPAKFLFLTKNPKRYKEFYFAPNCTLGATIESDYDNLLAGAPSRSERIAEMSALNFENKMISVEPIMRFSPFFINALADIKPKFVAVGYDNYQCGLPEPSLIQTELLIKSLQQLGTKVYRKTIRMAV